MSSGWGGAPVPRPKLRLPTRSDVPGRASAPGKPHRRPQDRSACLSSHEGPATNPRCRHGAPTRNARHLNVNNRTNCATGAGAAEIPTTSPQNQSGHGMKQLGVELDVSGAPARARRNSIELCLVDVCGCAAGYQRFIRKIEANAPSENTGNSRHRLARNAGRLRRRPATPSERYCDDLAQIRHRN